MRGQAEGDQKLTCLQGMDHDVLLPGRENNGVRHLSWHSDGEEEEFGGLCKLSAANAHEATVVKVEQVVGRAE